MCGCFQFPLLTLLELCSLFKQHLFHYVCVWILKRCTLWTCSCTATIFRAAHKRLECNVRPACGPAKIILQQKDVWNYKYFPLWKTGSQCRREGAQGPFSEGLQWRNAMQQAHTCLAVVCDEGHSRRLSKILCVVYTCADWTGSLMTFRSGGVTPWDGGSEYQGDFFQNLKIKCINDIDDKCVALCTVAWTVLILDYTNAGYSDL